MNVSRCQLVGGITQHQPTRNNVLQFFERDTRIQVLQEERETEQ